jgi:hypothetical protein
MIFRRKKAEDKVEPIETYYTQYIGYLGTNKYIPSDQDIYLHVYDEGILIQFIDLKAPNIEIPYTSMIDMQNISGGEKVEAGRVVALGLIAGTLWKKHHTLTIINYNNDQTVAFDFGDNIQKVQPMIYERMQRAKNEI